MGQDKYLIQYQGATLECDRVTNVLGATKGSGGLASWYGREERKALQTMVSMLPTATMLQEDPRYFVRTEEIRNSIMNLSVADDDDLFASRKRDEAGDSGTAVHALIHCDATGTKLPEGVYVAPEDWAKFLMWDRFRGEHCIEYVDSEMRVYSPNLMVAGTLDIDFYWDGVFWLGDFKTGALRRDAAVQEVIYWVLREETLAIQTGNTHRQEEFRKAYAHGMLPPIEWPRFGVIHIDDDGLEFYELDPSLPPILARNFLYRLQAYRDDQAIRPFRRMYPLPKRLKNGTIKDPIWLRAS